MVAQICERLGVPHRTLRVEVAEGNLQSQARIARYRALGAWCTENDLDALATAHQMDDQVETLVMRLNRGSGLSGLAGIRATTSSPGSGPRLVRPLLAWRRSELAELVTSAGIESVSDPSNEDDRFDRVRTRKGLAALDWLEPMGWHRSAELLAEADDAIRWMLLREHQSSVVIDPDLKMRYFPVREGIGAMKFRHSGMVELIFANLGRAISRSDASSLAERLFRGERVNLAGIAVEPGEMDGELVWHFGPENPRRTG